ncbi:MAG: PAS domain-containing protein [Desulfobulbaceae bacterium]|nr:PAS domain-containing protein [Desulfobulbaceae bacterium]
MKKKERNTKLQIILILVFVFVVLAAALFFLLDSRKNHNQQQHLQLITERYQFAYNTIYDQYKQLSTNIYSGLIKRFDIQDVYQKLLSADEEQKNRLRKELLAKIRPRYEELQKAAKVRQLHFHLRDNESFLRLHRPEKFGDNLTNVRETVNYVNTEHSPIDGFEEGRIYSGYRFVFPITAADQTHLGSLEISFGPEALTSSMMQQYLVLSNFFIKEETIKKKVFPDEQHKAYRKSHHKGYFYDKNVLAALKEVSRKKMKELKPQQNITDAVFANAHSGRAISLYAPSIDMVFTTIPVLNPVTHEMIAFLTIRSQSNFFINEIHHFRLIFSLSLLLLIMILSTFYLQYSKRKILEANTKQLKKQRQQLLEAQKIANIGHWEYDIGTNHLSWSDQIYRIFGLRPQQFAATPEAFLERVHPEDRDFVNTSYTDSVKNRQPYDIQNRIITKDGAEKWVRSICTTEYDQAGKPLRSLGIIHDITAQHNALTLLQRERDMFMNGPVVTFTWKNSKNWPVEQISANVLDLLGYSAKDFHDGSVKYAELIHPDDLQRVIDEVANNSVPENDRFIHEPYRLINRNGKSVWVLDCTTLVRDSQGKISHYQGYLVDISQTILMKKEILEAKNRLEFVIDGAKLGTWDWNVVSGDVIFNERWAEIIGYSLEEIEPNLSTWEKIVHPDEAEEIMRILNDHLQGRTSVYKSEHRLRHKSGKWIWVLDVGKVFERDAEGNPLRALGIHLDITENKEAAQALLESKEQEYLQRYITAIDDIGLGLCVVDADYRVRDMNRTVTDWFGDQRGKICYESLGGLENPSPYCCLNKVIEAGETVRYQSTTADGRCFDVVAGPLANPDGSVSKINIIRDITEQEQAKTELIATNSRLEEAIFIAKNLAKKAEAANQAKSVFLSNMSHELRTPLNAILGYTQLFAGDASLTLKQQSGIKTIHQAGEHLLMLINDILDLSKVEAGKMELIKTEFPLPEFLQGIVDIIRIRARAKELDFFYEPQASLPAVIETDELRLRQVILNLLSNAVKFTNSGHCTLRVQSQPAAASNKALLTITIEDSGAGIMQEMQEKIFEPFQQTGERLKYAEGYGLGLAISRKLIHLMGGTLQLVSPINEQPEAGEGPGSRFSFAIKVPVSGDVAIANPEKRKVTGYTVSGAKGGSKKILIVDDNAANRAVLRDTLEPLGFVAEEAENGREVLAACERFQPDAILMDLRMPEMDGFIATEQIKEHQDFAHVPVIAITASITDMKKLRQRCLEYGFSAYFIKPYPATELLETLADQLHIELQYAEGSTESSNEPVILPPPQDILDNLVKLAQSGDITGVSEQSAEIAVMESGKYRAFAHRIEQLADDLQLIEIEKFIAMCKKD